ncbi:MAG TPA: alpha/beta fold hydrolase [Ktedonobacteraceae bacterium]|nr:alpha/beta fold hydrolase [Ktedonobacteraceae bacterium]
MTSHPISIDAGTMKLSGRFLPAANGQPRALLVAVHGGTYTSKYFDTASSSLFELCASLGYSILALDRPGYGAAVSVPPEQLSFDDQVLVLRQALEKIWNDYGQQSAGMFLIGHSIGGMISLLLAAEKPHERLLGVNMTGAGALYNEQTKVAFASLVSDAPTVMMDIAIKIQAMYGPSWSYPEEQARYDPERDVPTAAVELAEAQTWGARLPQVAAKVRVPVQFIVPEYDHIWRGDPEALSHVAEMFTSAPFVDVGGQRLAGHSAELHTLARAFYMKILAFVEECIVYHSNRSSL